MKKIALLLACIICLFTGCTTPAADKITLVLDWTPNTNHTGFYVAKELGYYERAGIDIEIIQPPEGGALTLLAGNKAEFAVSFQEEIVIAITTANPLPVKAVAAILAHNTGGVLSLKEKNITRFSDLEGKIYGNWDIPIYDEILFDAIRKDGGDPEKIQLQSNNATDSIIAIQKNFDAVWVYEGWDKTIADTKGIETNFIAFKDIDPVFDYYTPVIASSEKFLKENPEKTRKFLEATTKGYEYAAKNPTEAAKLILKNAPEIGEAVAINSQNYLKNQYFTSGQKWGEIDKSRWDNFNNWLLEKGIIKYEGEIGGFTNEFLQ